MIGTPPCTGSTGMPSRAVRPAAMRSSQFLVVRRDTDAVRPFSIAIWAFAGVAPSMRTSQSRSEEHTSELQSLTNLVCRLLLEKKKNQLEQLNSELSASLHHLI